MVRDGEATDVEVVGQLKDEGNAKREKDGHDASEVDPEIDVLGIGVAHEVGRLMDEPLDDRDQNGNVEQEQHGIEQLGFLFANPLNDQSRLYENPNVSKIDPSRSSSSKSCYLLQGRRRCNPR